MKIIDNLEEFIEKIDNSKKTNYLDLSSDQDLSIAIMNLISIEEHLFFSGAKTHDNSFYDMINLIREDRKELLKKIIKTYKGEVWCISKHLLASCMRLMEVGTKSLASNQKQEAYNLFDKAYNLYCLFWALNINAVDEEEAKKLIEEIDLETKEKIENDKIDAKIESEEINGKDTKNSFISKIKNFVSKSVDCCKE